MSESLVFLSKSLICSFSCKKRAICSENQWSNSQPCQCIILPLDNSPSFPIYHLTPYMYTDYSAGLGTTFFYVQNALFFCVLLKNTTFFYILFLSFWRPLRPQKIVVFFCVLFLRMQRTQRSFAKNVKECKECNILMQKNIKEPRTLRSFVFFFSLYLYRYIHRYTVLIYRYI